MMTQIHPQTLLVALAIEFVALTLVALPAWRIWPSGSGMPRWTLGNASIAVSMGLLSQRGVAPSVLTVVVANALLIFGMQSIHVAVGRLYGAPRLRLWQRLPPLVAWIVLAVVWAIDTSPHEVALAGWRVLAFSVAIAWATGGTIWVLVTRAPRPWSLGTWYVVVALGLPVLGQVARAVGLVQRTGDRDPVIAIGATAVPLFASFVACGAFLTYGFFLLANDRLRQQLQEVNARLREDAATDPLTQVANRRHFDHIAAAEIRRAHRYQWPMTLLMLDIDYFKRVNDLFGHAVGDEVLRRVAAACTRHLRSHDLIARHGGEEFTILLPHSDLQGAEITARRLMQEIRDLHIDSLEGSAVTVSIGVAALAASDESIQAVLKRADDAMYRAKAAGRDRVAFEATAPAAQPESAAN